MTTLNTTTSQLLKHDVFRGCRRLRGQAAQGRWWGTRPRTRGCQRARSAWPWGSLAGHTRPPGTGPGRRRTCPTTARRCSSPRASPPPQCQTLCTVGTSGAAVRHTFPPALSETWTNCQVWRRLLTATAEPAPSVV